MNKFKRGFDSIAIKDTHDLKGASFAHTQPIFASSTYIYESPEKAMEVFKGNEKAYIYSRWNNPNVELIETKLAALEAYGLDKQAHGCLFGSGMAAISALFQAALKPGDTVIAQGNVYGTTIELLDTLVKDIGINIIYHNLKDFDDLEQVIKANSSASLIYIESPSNPTIRCYDLEKLSSTAKKYNIKTAIDNTFASPYLQQPLQFGIDYIVHSTTKYLNGHSNALGGIVISADENFIKTKIWDVKKLSGAVCSPFDAWLLNNGIKTLSLRMDKHCANTQQVGEFLENHIKVSKVNYLGLPSNEDYELAKKQMRGSGGVLSFELKDGLNAGIKLMKGIQFCALTASLGTPDTLIQHPASMSHISVPKEQREQYGITDGLVRMSVGLEDVEDIITDLIQALDF